MKNYKERTTKIDLFIIISSFDNLYTDEAEFLITFVS